jgi:hypothetical protein
MAICSAILANAVWHRLAMRAWHETCAEADRLDAGWRWEDHVARLPNVPEERNAAARVIAAGKLMGQRWPDSKRYPDGPAIFAEFQKTPPQHRLGPNLAPRLRNFLNSAGPALAEARRLADCPDGRVPLPHNPLVRLADAHLSYPETVVWGLLWPCLFAQVEDGEFEGALRTVRGMLYASRPAAESPSLVGLARAGMARTFAARGVERVLAQSEPRSETLRALQHIFEAELARPTWLAGFRGERAVLEYAVRGH